MAQSPQQKNRNEATRNLEEPNRRFFLRRKLMAARGLKEHFQYAVNCSGQRPGPKGTVVKCDDLFTSLCTSTKAFLFRAQNAGWSRALDPEAFPSSFDREGRYRYYCGICSKVNIINNLEVKEDYEPES